MVKDTQCQKALNYIKEHGSITPSEAYNRLHIYRLSGRIKDLRDAGVNILTEIMSEKNADGETVKYASYSLAKEKTA